jgi:Trypsin
MAFIADFDQAGNFQFACSGTVISPNVVLTAGHCTVDETTGATLDPSGFAVVTGSVDWTNSSLRQVSPVSRVIPYPAYNPSSITGDAGLLVLSKPITGPALRLASTGESYLDNAGTGGVIAGWGETASGTAPPAGLQWAATVVQSPSYCAQESALFSSFWGTCAVEPPGFTTGTCSGDSGGPLLTADANGQPVEIGITSYGPADCNTYTADYFTRADQISSWAAMWIAATAPVPAPSSPPPSSPPPSTPPPASSAQPQLPTMTETAARGFVRTTLRDAFPRTFPRRYQYEVTCDRSSTLRFSCYFSYYSGPNDYWGTVTVYYVGMSGGTVYWTDKYSATWVNDYCWNNRAHRRCKVHRTRGTV